MAVPKKLLVDVGDKCLEDTRGAVMDTLDILDDDIGLVVGILQSIRNASEETPLITRLRYDYFKKCKPDILIHTCIVQYCMSL